MTPTKSEPARASATVLPRSTSTAANARPIVTERGVPIEVHPERHRETGPGRIILYERLTGEAARERAMSPEPVGAGLAADQVSQVEYVEVWSTPAPARGYDFKLYSFGGALLATRTTRA
jgi:hypothetical protein